MAGDTVARSVSKFIYIRVGGQILRIYPPLNKPKTLAAITTTTTDKVSNDKKIMRIRTLIITLGLFGQLSCSNEDLDINSFNDDSSITTLKGTWVVISFENYTDNIQEFKNQENSRGRDIIIEFDDTKDPNELSGKNITNTVFGEFEYVGTRKFKVSNYGTTYVAQPVWADKFNQAIIDGEVSFKINKTGLRIYYDSETKSVTLTKK